MDLNNLILLLILVSLGLYFYKYFILTLKKNYPKLLIDDQLKKPQAFHESPIPTTGGVVIFFLFLVVCLDLFITKKIFFFEYISFCTLFFLLGFADDLKTNIKPKVRLFLMFIFLIMLIKYNNLYINNTGIEVLNKWITSSEIFSLILVCLCFLFIINGANLIDGYNGLLGIHSLIIFINLFFVNFNSGANNLAIFLFFMIVILLTFLLFNFPNAKIFLGDGGSYLLGSFIAVSTIMTSIENPDVSPFYFCIILFYLFFEVFFSFFRKLIKKQSPLYPDTKHLHMLLYKTLLKKNKDKLKSNFSVSIIINTIYFTLTIPAILMMKDGLFCKYYSMVFFIVYAFSYKLINQKIK